MKKIKAVTVIVFAVLSVAFYGCNSDSTEPPMASPPTPETGDTSHDHAGHAANMEMDAGQSDMDKMKAGLATLSAEDRAAAEKQHVCPVSGKMLGTMGAPYEVEVDGRQVWLCCPGCEKQLRENPDEFLAKLPD